MEISQTQSSKQVIDALLSGEKPIRMGIYDRVWDDTLRKWVEEENYPTDEEGNPVDPHDHLGFDLCGVGGGFDVLPLRGHSEIIEETEDWIVKRNGAGAALKTWKHKSGTPEHIDFLMTSRDIWEKEYRPFVVDLDTERIDVPGAKERLSRFREAGKWTFYQHLFVWENMRQSLGDVCLYESVLLDPDWIHDYCRVYTDFFKKHFAYLIEEAGKPDGIRICEDLGYKGSLFCSPKTYEELIFPYYREYIDFFHSYGLPVIFHSCGDVTEALPSLADLGIDALDPMEVKAGCDPVAIARGYGDKFALRGGIDVRVLESGDRDAIKKTVTAIVEGMKAYGARYIFSSDHSVSTNVGYKDYQYALNIFREQMYY